MTTRPLVSVVVPAYCEAEHIGSSLATIAAEARKTGLAFEIVAVDDGSTDGTWDELRRLGRDMPELRAVALSRNFGKEAAMLAGLETAAGDAVVVIDCDLQHPPTLIPRMVELWRQGYQVVNGVKADRGAEGALHGLAARLFYRWAERLARTRLSGGADFKLLDRRIVDLYCQLPERNRFFRGLVSWMGFRQIDVPFEVQDRVAGETKWSAGRLALLAADVVTSFSAAPLQAVTALGLLTFAVAVVVGAQTLYTKATGGAVEGFTTVILLMLFLNAAVMVSLGIIGQYVGKIYDEVKNRPRYLIGDSVNVAPAARRPDPHEDTPPAHRRWRSTRSAA